jgi:phosphoserine phosphatase
MGFKLVSIDADGTFFNYKNFEHGSSWEAVHEAAGTYGKSVELLEKYVGRKEMYDRWVKESMSLLRGGNVSLVKSKILPPPYSENAREAVLELKKMGLCCGIISAGLDIVCNYIEKDLDLDFCLCNKLDVENGMFTGTGRTDVPWDKGKSLEKVCSRMGVRQDQAVAVGDGENEIDMFGKAGLGIAYRPKSEAVKKAADIVVSDLREIPMIIRKF